MKANKIIRHCVNGRFFQSKKEAVTYLNANDWQLERTEILKLKKGNEIVLYHILPSV